MRLSGRFAAVTKKIKTLISQDRYDEAAKLVGKEGFDGLRKRLLIGLIVKMRQDAPNPKPTLKPKGLKELFHLDSVIRFDNLYDYNFNGSFLTKAQFKSILVEIQYSLRLKEV